MFCLSRIAGALVLIASAAGAQVPRDTTKADSAASRLPAVSVTESRDAATVGGASAVIVRVDELRSSPAPLLEQALRESPFILVRQNSRGEMELSVRGSDSRQAAVLFDGVPISLGWDHRTDPSLIPVAGVRSLVIVRGLSSVLNGPNTLGGTIALEYDGEAPGAAPSRSSSASVGSSIDENAAHVLTVSGERMSGGLSIRGGLAHRQRNGFRLARGVTDTAARDGLRTNSDMRQVDGFASLRWRGDRGRALGLLVSGYDAERGVPPELHISNPRIWRYPYQSRVFASLSGKAGSFATPFGYASVEGGAGFHAGRSKIQTYGDMRYQNVAAEELGDERTGSARLLATHSLPRSASLRAALTVADVRYTETLSPAAGVDYRQLLWSAGSEMDVPLGTRSSVSAGLVYDAAKTPETGGRPVQEPFQSVGWRAGATSALSPDMRAHVSASRRARFPALRELYSGALNHFEPNRELRPETLTGIEGGLTLDRAMGPLPDVTLQGVAYHHNLDDAVVRITQPDRRFKRVNRDRIESFGIELLAGMAFGADRDHAWSITGDALVQRIRVFNITTPGNVQRHAEHQPERRGMVELGIPLPLGLRATANARLTGVQYCVHPDLGEQQLSTQRELDVALQRTAALSRAGLFRSFRAIAAVDNVSDATVYDQCGLPQPGRTIRVGLQLR